VSQAPLIPLPDDQARRRRRREMVLMILLAVAVIVIFVIQTLTVSLPQAGSLGATMVFFALLDMNIILIIVLLFLILRNVTKLVMERRRGVLGSKLRTKLVVAFVAFALIPTMLLFYVAWTLTIGSLDRYLSPLIHQAFRESLGLAQHQFRIYEQSAQIASSGLSRQLEAAGLFETGREEDLREFVFAAFQELDVDAVEVYSIQTGRLQRFKSLSFPTDIYSRDMDRYLELDRPSSTLSDEYGDGQLVRGVSLVYSDDPDSGPIGVVVLTLNMPLDVYLGMQSVAQATARFDQFRMLSTPIRWGYLVILASISLLIFFSATWFGLYLSRGIAIPIQRLATATDQVAAGNLDVHVDAPTDDELGRLVASFNRMAADLKGSKIELEKTNIDLEERRQYMETILSHVGAGVIGLDRSGRISVVNEAARELLRLAPGDLVGRRYTEVIESGHRQVIRELMRELGRSEHQSLSRQVEIEVGGELLNLLVSVTLLPGEGQASRLGGTVVVFENLTDLLKAQRMAAWQEVARRIAHEIKNPLTPIQLSAQRLRKRYLDRFADDDHVFDESTRMIVDQVDDLKNMVNEFSAFARLAETRLELIDLNALTSEALVLHEQAHKHIRFTHDPDRELPRVPADPEQIRRVLMNLLDNAVDSIDGEGEIKLSTKLIRERAAVQIILADTGVGISQNIYHRLFEPYVSTKEHGTGLGLSIVKRIIADHNGYIRVKRNEPNGTVVLIELPLGSQMKES